MGPTLRNSWQVLIFVFLAFGERGGLGGQTKVLQFPSDVAHMALTFPYL